MSRPASSAVPRSVRPRRHVPLLAEAMEPRRLLATLNGGILQITGTTASEAFTVALSGTDLVVQRNAETPQRFARSAVTQLRASLGDGNDSILINDNVNVPASISGGNGNDTIRGGTGRDTVDGGSSWDTVTYAGRAAAISATVTMEIVRDSNTTTGVVTNYPNGNGTGGTGAETDSYRFIETIVGGNGNDTLSLSAIAPYYGDGNALSMVPLRGEGGGGNDQIRVWTGGYLSRDAAKIIQIVADGGAGNDVFSYNNDQTPVASLFGGDGNDTFEKASDDASVRSIDGGAGIDTWEIYAALPGTSYKMGPGLENFTVTSDRFTSASVIGNELNNVITVPGGTVYGGGGNDRIDLRGQYGSSASYAGQASGEAGNDTIITGTGNDTVDGGAGYDTIDYSARTAAVTGSLRVDFTAPTTPGGPAVPHGTGTAGAAGEADTLKDVETIVGGSGNDALSLNAREYGYAVGVALRAVGGAGNDRLTVYHTYTGNEDYVSLYADGGTGDDTFTYDGYDNTLSGGDGNDTFENSSDDSDASISPGAGRDTHTITKNYVSYAIPLGLEVFNGDANGGSAYVLGNDEANEIYVNAGVAATVTGAGGNDKISFSYGTYSLRSTVTGGAGNDSIVGSFGTDSIDGGTGDDVIDGSLREDTIFGGAGNDRLYGNSGDDRIDPGTGNDYVDGGGGGDAVVYSSRAAAVTGQLSATLVAVNGGYNMQSDFRATLTENGVAETDTGIDVDVLVGGNGNDALTAFANPGPWDAAPGIARPPLIINGGGGNDTLNVRGVANANGTIANTTPFIAFGGEGNDTLTARATTAARATLDGGNGNDTLGYAGNVGYFTPAGGAGVDTLRIFDRSYQAAALSVTLPGDVEDATVEAGNRVDVVGNALSNRITVNAPGTSIKGLGGNDTITGSNSADSLDGGDGDDSIVGNGGNDTLWGYAGNDRLFGGGGLDRLYGGIGNDFLDGGLGSDSLYGEAGTDTAVRDPADAIVDSVEAYA